METRVALNKMHLVPDFRRWAWILSDFVMTIAGCLRATGRYALRSMHSPTAVIVFLKDIVLLSSLIYGILQAVIVVRRIMFR